ncbi:gamma-butyrobetaine dioxygenase-like [Melitaea cinxia]|uniref:gamma-butyrobetaine dioxygenase-like n=1 Tax=Melitaea cinxia TaxID=113334 RepID=UPI001E2708DA|nr:gamma-butyrobetaine dioxygenase-like [Melitaea cinxia]
MIVLRRLQSVNISRHLQNISVLRLDKFHTNYILRSEFKDVMKIEINGKVLQFPYVWLRDNCQCEKCFHSSAKSRIIDWSKFDLNVQPKNVNQSDNSVQVIWNDGHVSDFKLSWLNYRSFVKESQKNYTNTLYKPAKITWHGDDFDKVFSKHDYNEIVHSDNALYDWLHKFSIYGVALIQNTPDSETAVDGIVDRIGFTKKTHYGEKFVVQHVANTSNVAYLSNNLQMHTDLPYYEYCPGVNLLHCLVQTASKGGENLLSDCHYTVAYMKEKYPNEYKLLTETEVEWSDVGCENGNEFYKLYRSPVICLDKHSQVIRINFSIPQRGSHFPGPIESVKPWYVAHSLFYELNEKFSARFKTKAGDILVFDNIRLLHGRNMYEDKNNNVRKLIGAYLDWDEIYSRLRCLKVKLDPEDGI